MESNLKRITAVLGPTNTGKTYLAVETKRRDIFQKFLKD